MITAIGTGQGDAGRPGPPRRREVFRQLFTDPDYLEFKERIGETLTPSEKYRLEAARAWRRKPDGGAS